MYSAAEMRNPAVPQAGVADDIVGRGAQKRDHHVTDVLGRAELPIAARGGETLR